MLAQKSANWFRKRHSIITASQVATILGYGYGINAYEKLLEKKRKEWSSDMIISSQATEWGNLYEPIANSFYQKLKKKKTYDEQPLMFHSELEWLGASPDAIIKKKGVPWKLVEYKCPYTRMLKDIPPHYYWIQCQIQMEVCDLNLCDLFEVKIEEVSEDLSKDFVVDEYGKTHYYRIVEWKNHPIKRDRKWFESVKDTLYSFYLEFARPRRSNRKRTRSFDNSYLDSGKKTKVYRENLSQILKQFFKMN